MLSPPAVRTTISRTGQSILARKLTEPRGRHVGGIVEEGAQEAHRAELHREAEPVVLATEPGEDRAVGFVEVEVAVELLLGRLAGVAAVAAALLAAEEPGRHSRGTLAFCGGESGLEGSMTWPSRISYAEVSFVARCFAKVGEDPMKLGYARVSTDDQTLDRQR